MIATHLDACIIYPVLKIKTYKVEITLCLNISILYIDYGTWVLYVNIEGNDE